MKTIKRIPMPVFVALFLVAGIGINAVIARATGSQNEFGDTIFYGDVTFEDSSGNTWTISRGDGGGLAIDQFDRGFVFNSRPIYIPADTALPININRVLYVPGLSVGTADAEVSGTFNMRGAANAEGALTAKAGLSIYPSTSDGAKFEIAEGVAPGSPTNGSIWTTIAGLFTKSTNGGTVGPLIGAAQVNTILASPPAIGSTAPAAGSFTDVVLSGDIDVNGNDIRTTGATNITSNNSTGGHITLTPRSGYNVIVNSTSPRFGTASDTFAGFSFYGGGGTAGKLRVREIYYSTSGSWEWQNLTDAANYDTTRMTLDGSGNLVLTGSLTCDGTVATSASSANVFNSPTTINAFTASTSTTIGATNGAIALRGAVTPSNLILSAAAPASNTATGVAGEVRYDGEFIYKCVATNTWARAALSASTVWP